MKENENTTKKIIVDIDKNQRVKEFYESKGLTQESFANTIGASQQYISAVVNNKRKVGTNIINKIKSSFSDFDEYWFLTGNRDVFFNKPKQIQPNKEVDTVDFLEIPYIEDENLESLENSFGNRFIKLDTGGYLMYMPLFEWDVAASLLDNDGDTRHPDYEDVAQHVTIVNEPLKGKYSAFRIKGGSMEGTEVNRYIPDGSIVWGRELQRVHWSDKLRINKHPLWIVGSTDFGRPTLKEIKIHDIETATIVVDSWNPSKEYAHNVAVSLNTVKMLYYIMKVESSISNF